MHPLAGQGLNLGIYDAAALLNTTLNAAAVGEDIGGPNAVRSVLCYLFLPAW